MSSMEFHVAIGASPVDLARIDEALRAADPAVLVDIDDAAPHGATLRIATSLRAPELHAALAAAGLPLAKAQLTQLPSICCGGCSG